MRSKADEMSLEGARFGLITKDDINGYHAAQRALEIPAAGDYTILLYGPRVARKATLIAAFPTGAAGRQDHR